MRTTLRHQNARGNNHRELVTLHYLYMSLQG
jgi:hypothetical protein